MSLNKKSVDDINVKGRRVLVRCDFNVPLKNGEITDETRIVAALPTIEKLVKDGGKVILCSHLGKVKNGPNEGESLAPVAKRLSEKTMTQGIGFDGSNYGYAPVENSDMVFIPVLDSAVIDTYASIPTLSMIGDVRVIDLPNNRPFDQYPRNVAIRSLEYMKELGIADQMIIGPEYEFYLFDEVRYNTDYYNMFTSIYTNQAAYASGEEDNNNQRIVWSNRY